MSHNRSVLILLRFKTNGQESRVGVNAGAGLCFAPEKDPRATCRGAKIPPFIAANHTHTNQQQS